MSTQDAPPAENANPGKPLDRISAVVREWWTNDVTKDVSHEKVMLRITDESALTPRYIFMTCMSAGIAILGMLLSSPAVVIGAMLLSPLMGPILGAGFALAEGKFTWLRLCAKALAAGTLFAVLFCALIVWLSPLQTVTEEIAARTRPNLFDLLVALFSSLAGSYAMIRGREGTIVGVAIATALMPPLAAVGYGLATFNMTVFGGALLLYVTNLLTIALTATVMARLYGFKSKRAQQHGLTESIGVAVVFVMLAIPLGISLSQIAREANGQRIVNTVIDESFDPRAQVEQPVIDWDAEPIVITATVFTPEFRSNVETEITRRLQQLLDEDVTIAIEQFRVGTDPGAAEQAALARVRAQQQAEATERQITALAERMALVGGVEAKDVTIDRENKRGLVSAARLDGLTLAGYRALEQRVSRQVPGWQILLRPPMLALPVIPVAQQVPDRSALDLVLWAAQRTGVPVTVSGPLGASEVVSDRMTELGIDHDIAPREGADAIAVTWSPGS